MPTNLPHYSGHEIRERLRQSVLLAALDRYLGLTGFLLATAHYDGTNQYEFDFYGLVNGKLIKVFRELDRKEIARYKGHPENDQVVIIIDCERLDPKLVRKDDGCDELQIPQPHTKITASSAKYLFYDDSLWQMSGAPGIWQRMVPLERLRCIAALTGLR